MNDSVAAVFEKWHGLGNDFVVVIDPADPEAWAKRASAICDRHRGVGADGILLVTTEPPSMRVVNADGSEPEMCGNGLRCVAGAIGRRIGATTLTVATGAGPLACDVTPPEGDAAAWSVAVEAGTVSFELTDAKVSAEPRADSNGVRWLDATVGGRTVHGAVASIGNPHWIFVDHPGVSLLTELGPVLEVDPRYTARTNVEFVTRRSDTEWRVDVWERGVGITQACGTGATAVAATLVRTGRAPADTPLCIVLPGGPLTITVRADGSAHVVGPAELAFTGTLSG